MERSKKGDIKCKRRLLVNDDDSQNHPDDEKKRPKKSNNESNYKFPWGHIALFCSDLVPTVLCSLRRTCREARSAVDHAIVQRARHSIRTILTSPVSIDCEDHTGNRYRKATLSVRWLRQSDGITVLSSAEDAATWARTAFEYLGGAVLDLRDNDIIRARDILQQEERVSAGQLFNEEEAHEFDWQIKTDFYLPALSREQAWQVVRDFAVEHCGSCDDDDGPDEPTVQRFLERNVLIFLYLWSSSFSGENATPINYSTYKYQFEHSYAYDGEGQGFVMVFELPTGERLEIMGERKLEGGGPW